MELKGRSVLITGGSRGLGAALATSFAERGARVVITGRNAAPLEAVAKVITRAGGEAHALVSDIADKDAIYALSGAAAALVGPIDVLIHNASTLGPTPLRLLGDTDCEDLEGVLAANVVGPFRLSKAIVGSMAVRGAGTVVHITSDASVNGYPTWGAYGVSKAALDHLARVWAAELADTGVRFLTIDPGEMDTRMHADAVPDADRAALRDPRRVADRIVAMLSAEGWSSGSRVEVAL